MGGSLFDHGTEDTDASATPRSRVNVYIEREGTAAVPDYPKPSGFHVGGTSIANYRQWKIMTLT